MRITAVRSGRTIKLAISAVIALGVLYILYSTPDAHTRAKEAIQSRFSGSKPREVPKLIPGIFLGVFKRI